MADVNANIGVNIDTSAALGQLKDLQRQISQFHTSIAKSSEVAALAQRDLQRNFLNSVNSIGAFSAELRTVKTTSESFTTSLEKNKFSMREYFRYAGASTKTFGKLFKSEYDTIGKVAEDRVKKLQTQYIKMGRDASGAMKAIAVIPNELDMKNFTTQTQLAAQKQALFNQLMKQGSTNLLNFGKNTQWAGRQLMVGFTLPLMAVGSAASKSFMQMEAQALKFKKVYGDLFTPQAETQQALADVQELAKQFTKYGIAVSDTVGLAADAAAAGFQGVDLQRQTTEATRLSVLGQIDNQQALSTTIALQNAFGISSAELAQNIDFLNAVENQTVVSLDDITTAIPKVAPVIQQLGGDVKDLAFFLTAMKEGGINASEGANALKSGLAALINPTTRARDMLSGLGIDINAIVNNNKGDLKKTVVGFAQALDTLAPLERARAIEQMFGKFQFARLSTLFQNVTKDGTQASRVLNLAGASVQELANLSEQELGKTADSSMNKFKKSVEDLKAAIVPVGEAFLKTVTPIIDFISKIAEKFSNLSDGTKKAITVMVTVIGGLGPILLMTFGLLANGVANIIKLFLTLRTGYQNLTGQSKNLGEQTQYMTSEQIDAAAAAHSLNQAHATLTQQFTVEAEALQKLIAAYQAATSAAARFATANPGMMVPPKIRKKFARGGIIRGPGGPKDDKIEIMASNGEAIIDAETVNANKKQIDSLLKTGKFEPKVDLSSGRSFRGTITNGGLLPQMTPEQIQARNERALAQIEANKARRVEMLKNSIATPLAPTGSRRQVNVPGTYNSAHFGGSKQMSGEDLITYAKTISQDAGRVIEEMVARSENGLKKLFNVFDNRVVATSNELNLAVGQTGSGKTAPIALAKKDLITNASVRDTELVNQLQKAGVPMQEIKGTITQITKEIEKGFDKLGKVATVTADDLDNIIQDAYATVSTQNEKVKAAYAKMKQVTAVADPTARGGKQNRISIGKSYKENRDVYGRNMEIMAGGEANIPYATKGAFQITPEMAAAAKTTTSELAAVYKQLSNQVKLELSKINGDVELFTKKLLDEAKSAGIAGYELGSKAITGIAKGTNSASDSKKAIQEGKNVTNGFVHAIQNGQDDALIAGEQLGNAGIAGVQKGTKKKGFASRAEGAPASIPMSQASTQLISAPKTAKEITKFGDRLKETGPKFSNMNNAIMGGTFALTSLAGVAQMFGGTLGNISNVVFNLSGALFGLMTITQLMTKQQFLALTVGRATAAKTAMSLVGGSGFTGLLSKASIGLRTFLGPVGLATIAVGGLVAGFKLLRDAQERERNAIEGLGNAAELTDKKLKALGGFFNVISRKSAFERGKTAVSGEIQVGSQTRTQLQSLKEDKNFQEAFAGDIKTLKGATNKQAKLIFDSLAINLKGKGYAAEQIQTIITALQEEAGKTDFKFDVKSIDLSTKEGQDRLAQNAEKLTKSLSKSLSKGITTVYRQVYDPKNMQLIVAPFTELSKAAKKNLNFVSKSINSTFDGLSNQLESGIITADQFDNAFVRISNTINAMPKPQSLMLMENLLNNLPKKLRESALGIGNISSQLLLLKAQAANVAVTAEIITAMTTIEKASGPNAGGRIDKSKDVVSEFEQKVAAAAKAYKKLNDAFTGKTGTGTGTVTGSKVLSAEAKLTIARLQKELDGLKTKRDLINEANNGLKRQYEYQQKLMQLSQDALQAKISGNYIGAAMIGQQKAFTSAEFNKETASIALDKKITTLENRISELQANAKVSAAEKALLDAKSKGKAMGGLIKGPGTGRSDSILAGFAMGGLPQLTVSNGEYVVQAKSVQNYGVGFMDAINNQKLGVSSTNTSSAGNTVYNIDMTINGGNQNPSDIADQVIRKLKIETSRNNKSNKVAF